MGEIRPKKCEHGRHRRDHLTIVGRVVCGSSRVLREAAGAVPSLLAEPGFESSLFTDQKNAEHGRVRAMRERFAQLVCK